MAGYYTSRRAVMALPLPMRLNFNRVGYTPLHEAQDVANAGASGCLPVGDQVTTSWRTGRGTLDEEQLEGSVQTPSTEAGVFTYLTELDAVTDNSFNTPYDNGHTFSTEKRYLGPVSHPSESFYNTLGDIRYTGPALPALAALAPAFETIGPFGSSGSYGAQAIAATAPTNPVSHITPGFFEILKDGLPHLGLGMFHLGEGVLKRIAQGHLETQFAWVPFIQDLRSAIQTAMSASQYIRQLVRDNGRNVRRGFHFPVETTTTLKYSGSGQLLNTSPSQSSRFRGTGVPWYEESATGGGSVSPQARAVRLLKREIWFKGAYTYHLSIGSSTVDKLQAFEEKADYLLDSDLDPDLLWQLAPWSWLVDWKWNIGDSIKNLSLFQKDGLVLRYGYLMVHTIVENQWSLVNANVGNGTTTGRLLPSVSVSFFSERKERIRSTPYGFGTTTGAFTPFQWSILGALGMTKTSNTMNWQ